MELERSTKKKLKVYIPLLLVVVAIIAGAIYWYIDYSKYITTDDAKIECDNVSISSKMLGRVVNLYYDEEDTVKKGELLVVLDTADIAAQYRQALAVKNQALANKSQLTAKYKFDQANLKVVEVSLEKNADDFKRAKNQYDSDVITQEQFDHQKKTYESSQAQLDAANLQLQVARTQIEAADAAIATADAQIGIILTQMKNTRLYAPMDGIIAKRWMMTGDVTQPGQSILTLSNNDKYWVTIFLEETKMEKIHIGQDALFTIDAYPDQTFVGKITSIGTSTASQFSLIPANNASGNFTKVTQRIPVKISIDGLKDKQSVAGFNLFAGMSVVVKILKNS